MTFDKNILTVSVKNGADEIDIKYKDEPMSISFNIQYLKDCLKNINADIINFGFTTKESACLISADNEINLLMPVLTKN